jgi:uncharacterized protein (TIGR00269 family)
MFDKRFRKTVRQFKMLKKGDQVAVGLSGGKDSTVLLYSLAELKKDLPFELVAITIDEGIAGYRERTMKPAKKACEELGIEQQIFSFKKSCGKTLDELVSEGGVDGKKNTKEKNGALPCSHCGVLRRYLLNYGARAVRANKLAIGHNLDDIAQTVFMNFMRAEPSRLARLNEPLVSSKRFVPRIRPLMLTPEKEIAIYAMMREIEIEHIECPYAYTALRGYVRKMINESEERYPGTKFKIVKSFLEIEDALRQKYKKGAELGTCGSCGEPSSQKICMFCKMRH